LNSNIVRTNGMMIMNIEILKYEIHSLIYGNFKTK